MPFFCILSPQGVALGWVNDCSFGAIFLNLMLMGYRFAQPPANRWEPFGFGSLIAPVEPHSNRPQKADGL
jgi:hypothetical protein